MRQLSVIAAILLLTSCSKTGIQVKNETDITLYSIEVSYYDKDGSLLNSYPVADSLQKNDKSKIMDVENRSDYAKIGFDVVSKERIAECQAIRDSLKKQVDNNYGLGQHIIDEMDDALRNVQNKTVTNKYYVKEKEITDIVINNTNKFN